nr:MAG TPA: hypothetical protein [Caudoviricetes sp.]
MFFSFVFLLLITAHSLSLSRSLHHLFFPQVLHTVL